MGEGPTDWTTGERVFAPPSGTLDVDRLVPAVLERCADATSPEAREALSAAWTAMRDDREPPHATALEACAAEVVRAAREDFRA